ncbi:hypothetical protein ACWGQ5_10845 [Streptomyces sp. NPDC055722]
MGRAVAAGLSVVVAAASGLVTNVVTERRGIAWWVGLVVLVVVGALLQGWLSLKERAEPSVSASGPGAVAVGGTSRGPVETRVSGVSAGQPRTAGDTGVSASGPGAVAVGRDVEDAVRTDVQGVPQPGNGPTP